MYIKQSYSETIKTVNTTIISGMFIVTEEKTNQLQQE